MGAVQGRVLCVEGLVAGLHLVEAAKHFKDRLVWTTFLQKLPGPLTARSYADVTPVLFATVNRHTAGAAACLSHPHR
jgi:hypothetical protein